MEQALAHSYSYMYIAWTNFQSKICLKVLINIKEKKVEYYVSGYLQISKKF